MKKSLDLLKEITQLTYKIEKEYPELYVYLDENPITIPTENHPDLNKRLFSDYLSTLKVLLEHHIETHRTKK
ncbi:hypothetical protein [uncultured Cytophaga sp.]|uniref:hypothetical protein n=1 Tax=uncultured Cytophaga sp. TaxID=160238 RepID=UPI002618A045|nr:hypothetical protein [uncultured Cytophaga sp.]